ncbi:hypothetical protein SAMN05216602_4538 [Pseudomonas argentinensis]|uniref:Uncharacterized protein n=1 Tax=Phytopseudomonas argentinensis TaxID=289370 RepID=A0A1I3PYA4_9GAMM|nr:hypothetical protein SAMN05216602_4538 [Pseudomonas argentinensis]
MVTIALQANTGSSLSGKTKACAVRSRTCGTAVPAADLAPHLYNIAGAAQVQSATTATTATTARALTYISTVASNATISSRKSCIGAYLYIGPVTCPQQTSSAAATTTRGERAFSTVSTIAAH